MENLLPCPFCGGKAELKDWIHIWECGTIIKCVVCGACVSEGVEDGNGWHKRAVKKWNRRARTNADTLCEDSFQVHLLEEIKRLEQKNAALREQLAGKSKEIDRYRQWVNDLQSGMYVNCVYCGHRYGPADKVPASMAEVLKQHVERCPAHPMSQLKADFARVSVERDAAIRDLEDEDSCRVCKYAVDEQSCLCEDCVENGENVNCEKCPWFGDPCSECSSINNKWQWRGLKEGTRNE